MKYVILLVTCTLLWGCSEHADELRYDTRCLPDEKAAVAEWTLSCIRDANPHSDEEPEDWISQCQRTGEKLLCSPQPYIHGRKGNRSYARNLGFCIDLSHPLCPD